MCSRIDVAFPQVADIHLVEAYWDNGGSKQRVVANLGRKDLLAPLHNDRWVNEVVRRATKFNLRRAVTQLRARVSHMSMPDP